MGAQKQQGFTIIEVLLFIAISGGLLAALLVGVNGSIEQQRYRDSVASLASYVQSQYDKALNTSNDRSNLLTCDASGIRSVPGPVVAGTTECLIIGRLIKSEPGGGRLRSTDIVVFVQNKDTFFSTSGVENLSSASVMMMLSDGDDIAKWDEYTPEWSATVSPLNEDGSAFGSNNSFQMAIVRSPRDGTIMTFVGGGAAVNPQDELITTAGLKKSLTLCVKPEGASTPQQRAIFLAPNTISPAGVATKTGAAGC